MKKHKSKSQHWKEYLLSFIILALLGALPGIFYGANLSDYLYPYAIWYVIYWAIVAFIFTFLTVHQRKKAFFEPLMILKEATTQVASGDFSVYLKPIFSLDQSNYIDQMFADFNKMVAELGSLETMKTDFIASVSHEIKTPLATIQGYSRMLQEPSLSDEERQTYSEALTHASMNLSTLVTNMLQLTKLEHQGILSTQESYNVCDQLTEIISSYVTTWDQQSIHYEIQLEDRATLMADPVLVGIIWRNLLSNATKFTPKEGYIRVHQTSSSDHITVVIEDSGIGMSETTQRHLFEKFYQGDTSRSVDGNGLGLALVSRSIELLDGSIHVESELGQGSRFIVKLKTQEK